MLPVKCECGARPFVTLMRGQVVRTGRLWYWPFKRRPKYAVICWSCKDIVGWEWLKEIDFLGTKHLSLADSDKVLAQYTGSTIQEVWELWEQNE